MSPTRVRDWARVDFYAVLGVDADATDEEIAQAFRSKAKQLHPDATGDAAASEQFHDLSAAYDVLSDPRLRRDYDIVHRDTPTPPGVVVPMRAPQRRRTRWTRRQAGIALAGGVIVTSLGIVATFFTWYLHDRDANERSRFVPVVAQRVGDGDIAFVTTDGVRVQTDEPRQRGEAGGLGPTVKVRYDPANPETVVVDAGTFGRDITLAIVALKFLVGGPVFIVLGARRLRRA